MIQSRAVIGYKVERMESSTGLMEARADRDPGTIRLIQIGLLLAVIGALIMVFGLFGLGMVGLVLVVIGTLLAARGGLGRGWYTTVAIGALLAVIGRLVAEGAETLGGWLAVLATVLVFIGVSLGYPTRADRPE
jgi:hypothetical protein